MTALLSDARWADVAAWFRANGSEDWADGLEAERAARIEAEAALAEALTALGDLLSWFPDEPSKPEWRIKAGEYGADDAVDAARATLSRAADREAEPS